MADAIASSSTPYVHVRQNVVDDVDALRSPESALMADARTDAFTVVQDGRKRKYTQLDHHGEIACFELNQFVPKDVRIHFETAKNLYLYAWFVFRFYPVAEQQALASLEFALRQHLLDTTNIEVTKAEKLGLSELLKRARNEGFIRNERLLRRRQWATEIARDRYCLEQMRLMDEAGCTEMLFDDSQIQPTQEDLAHDWIGDFIENLPKIRNNYAHGSSTLHRTVLRTFAVVSDLTNQLFMSEST